MFTNICGKKSENGYAVAEMMVFGAVLVLVTGVLFSYVQQVNDQQYVKQETFRRALNKANRRAGPYSEGPGASVQYYRLENRRHMDIDSQEHARGVTDGFTSDASVFWAVPTEPAYLRQDGNFNPDAVYAQNEHYTSANDQEQEVADIPQEFFINTYNEANYHELAMKNEVPGVIINEHYTVQGEGIENRFPGWAGRHQRAYLTPDGQVRYSELADGDFTKDMIWVTPD